MGACNQAPSGPSPRGRSSFLEPVAVSGAPSLPAAGPHCRCCSGVWLGSRVLAGSSLHRRALSLSPESDTYNLVQTKGEPSPCALAVILGTGPAPSVSEAPLL